MGRVKCCKCGKAAVRMINGKYYCKDCSVSAEKPTIMPKVDTTPKCGGNCACNGGSCSEPVEKPKTEGFWDRLAKWIGNTYPSGF